MTILLVVIATLLVLFGILTALAWYALDCGMPWVKLPIVTEEKPDSESQGTTGHRDEVVVRPQFGDRRTVPGRRVATASEDLPKLKSSKR